LSFPFFANLYQPLQTLFSVKSFAGRVEAFVDGVRVLSHTSLLHHPLHRGEGESADWRDGDESDESDGAYLVSMGSSVPSPFAPALGLIHAARAWTSALGTPKLTRFLPLDLTIGVLVLICKPFVTSFLHYFCFLPKRKEKISVVLVDFKKLWTMKFFSNPDTFPLFYDRRLRSSCGGR